MYCVAVPHGVFTLPTCRCSARACVCVCLVSSFHEHAVQPAAVVACSLNICGVNTNSTKAPFPQGKHWRIQCVNASPLIIHLCRNRAIFPPHCINNSGVAVVWLRGSRGKPQHNLLRVQCRLRQMSTVCCKPRLSQWSH